MPDDRPTLAETVTLTRRDRLMLAFTELTMYGIAAQESVDAEPDRARHEIAAGLRMRAPHGLGSFVFWVRADDHRVDTGAEFLVHTSGPEVDRAVTAACARHGLPVSPGPRAGTLLVRA